MFGSIWFQLIISLMMAEYIGKLLRLPIILNNTGSIQCVKLVMKITAEFSRSNNAAGNHES